MANLNAKVTLFVVLIAVFAAMAFAYPVIIRVVGNMDNYTTSVFRCTDSSCASFVEGSRYDTNPLNATHEYSLNASGTAYFAEFDYAACRRPYSFIIHTEDTVTAGPHSHTANLELKIDGISDIQSITIPSTAATGSPVQISVNAKSAFTRPEGSPIGIPTDLQDEFSSIVNVTLVVKDSNGVIVFSQSQTGKILTSTTKTFDYTFVPSAAGTYTIEARTTLNDCKFDSATSKIDTLTRNLLVREVKGTPDVNLISPTPAHGTILTVPSTFSVSAESPDTDLRNITIYVNNAPSVTCNSSPCNSAIISATGTYEIYAKAVDTAGLTGQTETRKIQIRNSNSSNTAPNVTIMSPFDGSTFREGRVITFVGEANDAEDGRISDFSMRWSSDINGFFGTGRMFTTSSLSLGVHHISLSATDSEGATSTAGIITIIVSRDGTIIINSIVNGTFYSHETRNIFSNFVHALIVNSNISSSNNIFSSGITLIDANIQNSNIIDGFIKNSDIERSPMLRNAHIENSSVYLPAGITNMILNNADVNNYAIQRRTDVNGNTRNYFLSCSDGSTTVTFNLAERRDMRDMCNFAPIAAATISPTSGNVQTQFTFDASASSDPNVGFALGDAITYEWAFGDGTSTTTTTATTTHTYSSTGTYTPTLNVYDRSGASSIITLQSITVSAADGNTGSGGGGGGSGDGGTGDTSPILGDVTLKFTDIQPQNNYEFPINREDLAITKVKFSTNREFSVVWMAVSRLSGSPHESKPNAYQYAKIDSTMTENSIDLREVQFRIRNSWFNDNNIERSDVRVSVWNGAWVDVTPSLLRIEGDYSYFEASVPVLLTDYAFWAVGEDAVDDGDENDDGADENGENEQSIPLVIAGISILAIILLVILIALLSRFSDRNRSEEVPYAERFDRSKYDEEMK